MVTRGNSWRSDLEELLAVCERRAARAEELPHCAICARSANTSPAFEGVLSLLETLPPEKAAAALAAARGRLARLPASQRTQQVSAVTFGVLLDSPGWPLVGHLVIDLGSEESARYLSHPGLLRIEELTLLGFAYGNATPGSRFTRALLESSLLNVRVLRLHSADLADEDRPVFWASPFAARLERIEGVAYRGEALPHPLQATEIKLRGAWDPVEEPDGLLRLVAPGATPRLKNLDLGCYYAGGAAPALLRLLAAHRGAFERIEDVSLAIYGRGDETQRLLAEANLPRTLRTVSWSWHSTHGTIFTFAGDIHTVYGRTRGDDVSGLDAITHYSSIVAELADVGDLSRGLREVKLIAPPEASPEEILEALGRFPALERLSLVYPFTETQLLPFLQAVGYLSLVKLYLTMRTGCGTTEYIEKYADGYRSDVKPGFLLETALAARELSLYSDVLDVSRTPSGVEHLTLKSVDAVLALARLDPAVPIESLTLETRLTATGAGALVRSRVLSRVYRLALRQGLTDDAAMTLAGCAQVREVRSFSLAGHQTISPTAFALMVGSPHLAGVLDLSLWTVPEGGDVALSAAPLLPRLVTLDLHDCESSEVLPASGRLTWLRQVSGWLTMFLLEDGRLAKRWLGSGAAGPLAARLRQFLRWVYRVPQAKVPGLIAALEGAQSEDATRDAIRDLVARAFGGEPVLDGTPFASLSAEQQAALRAVAGVDDDFWCVVGLLSPVFKSYGLPPYGRESLEQYIAGNGPEAQS
jgi:hypothetical protein